MECRLWFNFAHDKLMLRLVVITNVPPSFRDGGAWERGNTHWGRVETPQNFGVFWGAGGQGGVRVSKIIKK